MSRKEEETRSSEEEGVATRRRFTACAQPCPSRQDAAEVSGCVRPCRTCGGIECTETCLFPPNTIESTECKKAPLDKPDPGNVEQDRAPHIKTLAMRVRMCIGSAQEAGSDLQRAIPLHQLLTLDDLVDFSWCSV